jgi:hypothetical protein
MPFLTINGSAVPVARDSAQMQTEPIGDQARAFDGTLRSTRRGIKRRWQVTTAPLPADASATLQALLASFEAPLVCTGDLIGATVECEAEIGSVKYVAVASGHGETVEFTLVEV